MNAFKWRMSPCRANLSQELERNLHLINAPCSWELSYRMSVTVHDMIHELKSLFFCVHLQTDL